MDCSRRSFLKGTALVGGGILSAGLSLGVASQALATEGTSNGSNADGPAADISDVSVPVDEALIANTIDTDVAVIGLGVAGVAAMRAACEGGLKVVGIEKCATPSARSSMFTAFNTDHARQLGIDDVDTTALANEYMVQMCHRADFRVMKTWLDHCGEAFDWYAEAYDGIIWVGPNDEYPSDPDQACVSNFEVYPDDMKYQYGRDHEKVISACQSFSLESHQPILQANLDKAIASGNGEAYFNSSAKVLDLLDGKVTGVVFKNLEDGSYTRVNAKKGVVIATGGYTHNDAMLAKYAPWVSDHKERYFFAYPHVDFDGNPTDTGDGHMLGLSVGGHLDVGPHAVMAHSCLGALGVDAFLQLNERGERYCNEDLTTTHFSAIFERQPGTKVYQIIDGNWASELSSMQPGLGNALDSSTVEAWYGEPKDWAAASGDTIDELIANLGVDEDVAANMKASIEHYNSLCDEGTDEDFGKTATRMFALETPPFYALVCDTDKPGSIDDVTCLRVLVTLSGLVTDVNARVIDDAGLPIEGLFAIGNAQGGRFVDDYPTTVSGASHGAALTYGYLTGKYLAAGD